MPIVPSDRRNRVFIGGIGDRITKEDIEAEFGRYGKLTNVWVAQNPPGFAFVEFDHIAEADLAVNEMNGKSFMGSANKIRVEHSHGGKSRNGRRGGGGGRFDGPRSSFGGGPRGFNSGGDGGYRSNGGGYRRMGRDGGGFGGGSGRFDGGDKRRPFQSGGGGGGRFPSGGGGGGGPPRYGRSDRPYGGPRRSRSPSGRSNKYPPRIEPMSDHGFSPIGGGGYGNPSQY
ncbi:uncharacterized protein LOC113794848 isoform X1 [Dermatophagoides pteronyssinus]|uniref:RNA-binding protein Rsf1-like isoform X1 n=2 Tax=Dermatophagoides pteronyssinus TaxID=6956 RepID=A0A6P6Y706_DERPT|nr:RNA-binding protein Rsf1-like isoform X1 [Dermatophagoides pteronyssinus]